VAASLGVGVFLAAWGVSLLWRYTPPEITVRVANPEVHIAQEAPLVVKQDTPFVLAASEPLKIEQGHLTVKVEQPASLPMNDRLGLSSQTAAGDVIKREVTIFSQVQHDTGRVVTGWNYKDGRGGTPVSQFCYYTSIRTSQASGSTWLPTTFAGPRSASILFLTWKERSRNVSGGRNDASYSQMPKPGQLRAQRGALLVLNRTAPTR
jgi:hypothetical protein